MDTLAICDCPKRTEPCDHDWVLPEWAVPEDLNEGGWPQEVCSKCGMSMIRYIFTECP